ncbi:MAG TPA: hypothetical protein VD731_05775 [Nitrosopumilaceae archaeon]|nr:hypothetical protein [Nitrosopumilaceae archaeon]
MALRVISTKLTEEQYGKLTQVCDNAGCTLSAFLKECVMDLVGKEATKLEKPIEETIHAPEFTISNESPVQEQKLTQKIRYQYF